MRNTIRGILTGMCMTTAAFTILSATAMAQNGMPQTTKETIQGTASVTTQHLQGTVVEVDGNTLLVRMAGGGFKEFNVPDSRKFNIDGQELTVHDLKPGTKLTATTTTTTTPVTERTTTVGSGKVWWVNGNNVILTLPNGENHMYKVQESYRFNVNGQPATVHDLRKGMLVSAEKIVETPKTEIASNTVVTGHAPAEPKQEVAAAPAPAKQEATPAPAPAPAPAQVAEAKPPAELPKTGSELPLFGALGLLLTGASFFLRRRRVE